MKPLRQIARGRLRLMSAVQCLRLLLSRHRTRGCLMTLCLLFGVTHSTASLYIRFARRLLYKMLINNPKARVKMPTVEEIEFFKAQFERKHYLLNEVYCVADGLKLYLQQAGDCVIQNMFYNGGMHDHYVCNIFVFAPNGRIIACTVTAPGSFHDSTVARFGGIYDKLEACFSTSNGICVVDSAFCRENHPFLLKSSQDYLYAGETTVEIIMYRKLHQPAKALSGECAHLREPFQDCRTGSYMKRMVKECSYFWLQFY